MATYDIDLLRALMVDKLNDNSIFLASFYEQIQDEEQITRYVDSIKELIALQNSEKSKSGYKAMGIISQSGSADILNIKQNYIVPLEYDVRLDIEITDRDYVLGKIKQLIDDLRGRKFDVIQLVSGQVVIPVTPTLFSDVISLNVITNKQFIPYTGDNPITGGSASANFITHLKTRVALRAITANVNNTIYFPFEGKLYSTIYTHTTFSSVSSDVTAYNASPEKIDITTNTAGQSGATSQFLAIATSHRAVLKLFNSQTNVTTYFAITLGTETNTTPIELGTISTFHKISMSFNGIQSQEPYINNGVDRVFLFFGGSATIVDNNVTLGNDIITTTIQKGKDTGTIFAVEPTELTGSLDVSDDTFQTWANGYQSIDRNMAIANKVSYSFVFDRSNTFYEELYKYGRYGFGSSSLAQLELTVKEYRYSFGVLTIDKFYAKLGSVNTQNTNGDVMTISILLKVGAY
jgi:hypothetical protein